MKMKIKSIHRNLLIFFILNFFYANLFATQNAPHRSIFLTNRYSLNLTITTAPPIKFSIPANAPKLPPGSFYNETSIIKETYIITLTSYNKEYLLDKFEYNGTLIGDSKVAIEDTSGTKFAIYNAGLIGDSLYYLFIKNNQLVLAHAKISASGEVSSYKQTKLPEDQSSIFDKNQILQDKSGQFTVAVREPGKLPRPFDFETDASAFSVPVEASASSPRPNAPVTPILEVTQKPSNPPPVSSNPPSSPQNLSDSGTRMNGDRHEWH